MKVRQLIERAQRIPVSVEWEQEFETSPGEWDSQTLVISGNVTVERDPFGTGDSPTEYTFEPTGIVDKSTGQALPLDAIASEDDWEHIETLAQQQLGA